jgi:hypothetical protein
MALLRVNFSTHEGDWMLNTIQEKMQVSTRAKEFSYDMLIVPVPNDLASSRFDSLCANVARNA